MWGASASHNGDGLPAGDVWRAIVRSELLSMLIDGRTRTLHHSSSESEGHGEPASSPLYLFNLLLPSALDSPKKIKKEREIFASISN